MSAQPMILSGGDTVKNITDFLAPGMREVERLLRETIDSDSRLIREVGDYVGLARGKKLRPALTLLTARALAPELPPPAGVATALELIHVATLMHDDVIDRASTRRGQPSVNAKFGDDVAILMADFLYSRAFDLALESLRPEIMRVLTQVTQKMCEGEMFQIEWRGRNLSPDDYFQVVERKTGQLFSACGALGAFVAGRPEREIEAARRYGFDFGVAFQITDDILDFAGSDARWGKEVGMDVSGGKQTLPLVLALTEAGEGDRALLEKAWSNGRDFNVIRSTVERCRGIELASAEARRYADRALDHLGRMAPADPEAWDHLRALPLYVVGRLY